MTTTHSSVILDRIESVAAALTTVPGLHVSLSPPDAGTPGTRAPAPIVYLADYAMSCEDFGSNVNVTARLVWQIRTASPIGQDTEGEIALIEQCFAAIDDSICSTSVIGASSALREGGSNYMYPQITITTSILVAKTS